MQSDSATGLSPTPQGCLICGQPCADGELLCSRQCLLRANRELDENVAVLRRRTADPDTHAALATRNGYLTSALVRWTTLPPRSPPSDPGA
jgi:hypothetical protein